jgi:hypothetical protein
MKIAQFEVRHALLWSIAVSFIAVAVAATLLLSSDAGLAVTGVDDETPGSIGQAAIDADPTGNTAPGSTLVGEAYEPQGELDACVEVGSGATFEVDIILDQVPEDPGTSGGGVILAYNGSIIQITGITSPGIPFHAPETFPNATGTQVVSWGDFSNVYYGELVFATVTFQAVGSGTSPIDIQIPGDQGIIPGPGVGTIPVNNIVDGSVAVGGSCTGPVPTTPPATTAPATTAPATTAPATTAPATTAPATTAPATTAPATTAPATTAPPTASPTKTPTPTPTATAGVSGTPTGAAGTATRTPAALPPTGGDAGDSGISVLLLVTIAGAIAVGGGAIAMRAAARREN